MLRKRGRSVTWPGRWRACRRRSRPPSRLVETARREPLGMSLTLETISSPSPGPTMLGEQVRQAPGRSLPVPAARCRRRSPPPSAGRGNRWRSRRPPASAASLGVGAEVDARPAAAPARRSRAGRPRPAGAGAVSRPWTARSIETFSTRAPSGKSIPRKKMSLQRRVGQVHPDGRALREDRDTGPSPALRLSSSGRMRSGWSARMARCGTSTGCRGRERTCAAPGWRASGRPVPVGGGEGGGDGVARAVLRCCREEDLDGLLEARAGGGCSRRTGSAPRWCRAGGRGGGSGGVA